MGQPLRHRNPQAARAQLQRCLTDGRIQPTRHFREELAKEELSFEDVWVVLRSGNIYTQAEQDINTGEWKYRVEGSEPNGRWLVAVVSFKAADLACLITVSCDEARRREG